MKTANGKLVFLGLVALLSACATPEQPLSRKDPFADPSKFESLASGPFTVPAMAATLPAPSEVTTEVAPALATKPVPYSLIDGGSLFSAALPTADLSYSNRAPASVIFPKTADTPETSLDRLVNGNERFVIGSAKGEHRDENRRKELVGDQKPFAVVLSCSDSRVPPELIFDQGLGDLFTIRVAGNVLGSAQVASIEYAVAHLGAKLIVVMGHESCGAVKAAIDAGDSKKKIGESASPDMDWLVTSIRPALKSRGLASLSPEDPKLRKPVMANIDAVTDNLVVRSKVIGEAIAKGNLKVVRGIYSLESGRVEFWGLK